MKVAPNNAESAALQFSRDAIVAARAETALENYFLLLASCRPPGSKSLIPLLLPLNFPPEALRTSNDVAFRRRCGVMAKIVVCLR